MKQKVKKANPNLKQQTGLHVRTQVRMGDYRECYRDCKQAGGTSAYCDAYCKNFWPG